jgi:TfoX/Sxy family transcriptional regulator of competence genes
MKMPEATDRAKAMFESVAPKDPAVRRRKMFGQPAAFLGSKMVCGVFGDQVVVRLSAEDYPKAVQIKGAAPFEPMEGRAMSGWVAFPSSGAVPRTAIARWIERSLAWVAEGSGSPQPGTPPAKSSKRR